MAGCLSMSILASLTLPRAALTAFSSTGVSCLQGPHHSAQKSTSTGCRRDSSITSFMKDWVVTSLMAPSAAGAVPAMSCSIDLFLDGARPEAPEPKIPPHKWVRARRIAIGSSGAWRDRLDPRRVPGGLQERHQVVACNRRGHGVDQRMTIDDCILHQARVEHDIDAPRGVVDHAERRHGARFDAEQLAHQFGRAEGKASRAE